MKLCKADKPSKSLTPFVKLLLLQGYTLIIQQSNYYDGTILNLIHYTSSLPAMPSPPLLHVH
ncbi:hypothetical protein SAMN05518672_106232 [Chitinophaga sp. CF118]|nr:hypothetical protein SAMN05518672_106232 [Chitinophaga sp. CF118]